MLIFGFLKKVKFLLIFILFSSSLFALKIDSSSISLDLLLQEYSKNLGVNFVITDEVRKKNISLYFNKSLSVDNTLKLLENLLPKYDLQIEKTDFYYLISPISKNEQKKNYTYQVKNISSKNILENLTKQFPEDLFSLVNNTLLIKTTPKRSLEISELLISLDKKETSNIFQNVKITIYVFETDEQKLKDLGSSLSASYQEKNDNLSSFVNLISMSGSPTVSTLNKKNLALNLNYLQNNSITQLLSKPTIIIKNGETSKINVGSVIRVADATNSDSSLNSKTTYKDKELGLTLTVSPLITPENDKIIINLKLVIENLISMISNNPQTSKKEISSNFSITPNTSILIGGLISSDTITSEQKVPFLSSIPLFGWLFKNEHDNKSKKTLSLICDVSFYDSNESSSVVKYEDIFSDKTLLKISSPDTNSTVKASK